MAAGLGFKTFTTGEVLTAADTNGYLMQGVLVFASAAARDAAITSPQEGQFAYLKDTNVTTYYTGSAWTNLDTTGMTNPMTTTGDMVYSSSGSTPARLGIGSTGQVITVAGGIPSWATPAGGGGMTSIASGSLSGTSVTLSSIAGTYKNLQLILNDFTFSSGTGNNVKLTANSITNYSLAYLYSNTNGGALQSLYEQGITQIYTFFNSLAQTPTASTLVYNIFDYANTSAYKVINMTAQGDRGGGAQALGINFASVNATAAITSLTIGTNGANFSSGTYTLYGVQ
jgi:hypothetical protein